MAAFKSCVKFKRNDGLYSVYIRVIHNRKVGYIKTDKISDSSDNNGVFKDVYVNKYCATRIAEYAEKLNKVESKNWTVNEIIAYLNSTDEDVCFSEYAKKFTDAMFNRGQERNSKSYRLAVSNLERYVGTDKLMFSQLTKKVLEGWIESLSETARAKEMYPVCVRQIFRMAMIDLNDEDRDVIIIKSNPFLKIRIPESDLPEKRAVNVEILREFVNAKMPPSKMLVQSEQMGKDVAMMILFLGGINTADIFSLKEDMCDDEVIRYNRLKTKNSRRDKAYLEIPIPECVKPILKKYRAKNGSGYYLNFFEQFSSTGSFNTGVNIGIYRLCQFNGMKRLSSYTFRHSFATICCNDLGYSDGDVAFAMNHSSGHSITKGYIKEDWNRTTRMCDALYEYIVNKKKAKITPDENPEESISYRIVSSYKSLIYATLYFNRKKIGEIADVGFNNIKEVMEKMNEFLPDDIPEMSKVELKIENADTGNVKVYTRMVRNGKICVNEH